MICQFCNSQLFIRTNQDMSVDIYCESQSCNVSPYTRYFKSLSPQDNIEYEEMIIDINGTNYMITNDYEYINITSKSRGNTIISVLEKFIETNFDGDQEYINKHLYYSEVILPWNDLESATKIINKILKIKAFL